MSLARVYSVFWTMQYRKSADDLSKAEMGTEKFKERENNPKKI